MREVLDPSLFFLHVPKTAGTSFRELVTGRFAQRDILTFRRSDSRELRIEQLATLDRYRFVHGHLPYALVDRFQRRPFVATILRDPLERALSAFQHMQSQAPIVAQAFEAGYVSAARARDYAAAGRMSIGDLIRQEPLAASRHLGNLQAWFLSTPDISERFEYSDDYRIAISDSDLERAKERLAACDVIGLTERMSDTMDFLAYVLRMRPFGEVSTANRSFIRPAISSLDEGTIEALVEITASDRELYTSACLIFEERRRAMMNQLLLVNIDRVSSGVARHHPAMSPIFTFESPIPGDGWYAPELSGERWFCWTGPTCDSTIELGSPPGREFVLRLGVLHAMQWESLSTLDVRMNGVRLNVEVEVSSADRAITATVPRALVRARGEGNLISIRVPAVFRPSEQDCAEEDSRLLGIAVHRAELAAVD